MTKKFKLSIIFIFVLCMIGLSIKSQDITSTQAQQLLNQVEQLQIQNEDKINAAFTAMEAVQKAGAYIESLSDLIGNGVITLPVGIKKGDYELIIQKLKYNKETGKTNIYGTCAFKFKDDGQKIAFEGNAVLEGQKGLGTSGSLKLIAPVRRNLGNQAAIVFNSGTQVNFGCEGIESFLAKIDLIVTSEKIIAVDKQGKPSGNSLTSSFEANFYDFDNYTVSFSFGQSFSLNGLKDIVFTLKGASLDQSDEETPATVHFPPNYFSGDNPNELKLWKGIAITEATLALPAIFKKSSISGDSLKNGNESTPSAFPDRIELSLSNVLFDDHGFTGNISANDIMMSDNIDKTKWDITVDDFMLSILKNDITGFGFGGDLNIPPLGKNSLLPYMATFNPSIDEYEFQVTVSGKYDFPVLRSSLSLNETSTIEILFKDSEIYPTLNASGFISIDAPINASDSTKKFTVPDITFENMKISRAEPYFEIGAIGLTGDLKSPKVAGFELSISDIRSFENNSGAGLAFVAGIKLNDMFGGEGGLLLYGDYAHWKFDRVGIDRINVDFKSSAFSISGGVLFKNGDEIYGSGFRGDIAFVLINKFNLDAVAIFGKKDDYRYFLTDVFLELPPTSGITIPPALSFYGFGGGLYRRMQQSSDPNIDSEFGKSLSGINYIPDNTVGMGFMTSTKFGLIGSSSAFSAKVGFEMQFNNSGGLNFIQLRGDATFMDSPEKWGRLADNINKQVEKLEAAGGKIKLAAKSDLKVPENKSSGFLTASMNVKFDIANKVFSADISAYLNAGFIKGVGENDRMGWASAYFSPDKWYTYIGTPSDRLGIEILGLARADGYFMVGDDIPELPLPPQKVLQNFSREKQEKLNSRSSDELTAGSGLAFGQSFSFEFKATLPPFYAQFGLGMGAEFLLKNYGANAYCAGGSTTLGINGWYARAQAWAWVEADIGLEARIFRKTRKFSILDISASALLAGAGPNPFYFTGAVGGRFSVMGGLISGQCDFDFEIGEECKIMGGSPFGEEIIGQLTPSPGENDVNVFASPQAVFNIPVGLEMEIEEDDGLYGWYKITIEEFSVYYKDTKQKVDGYFQLSQDGKIYMLDPSEPFESQKDMVVYAKVGFKRKLNGQWINVSGTDGQPLYEEKTAEYKSGDRPKEILPEHVKYSYPIARQYNYYPKEYDKGYVLVTENYSYLFTTEKPVGFNQVLRISDFDGKNQETAFAFKTNAAGNEIRFEIDFSTANITFSNNEIYKLAIVNVPQNTNVTITSNIITSTSTLQNNDSISVTKNQAEGNLEMLQEKEIYALHFRTSKYNSFEEKIAGYDTKGTSWRDYVEPFVHHIKSNITDDEFFDKNEMQWQHDDFPIIRFEAQTDNTNWFKNSVYKNMYKYISLDNIKAQRDNLNERFNDYGYPPKAAVAIENMVSDRALTDDEIKTGTPAGTFAYGIFTYSLPFWCSRDFFLIKNNIALKLVQGKALANYESEIIATDYPPVVKKGSYPTRVSYVLPGRNITTSSVEIEMYNPVD